MPREKTKKQLTGEIKLLKARLARLEAGKTAPAACGSAALSECKILMQAILDGFPFLAWLKDPEGRFIAVNNNFAAACSQPNPETVIGKTDADIWPRELAQAYRADDDEVMRSRTKKNVEELVADRGVPKWFETFKTPVVDASGHLAGTFGFSRDITGRKRAEAALANHTALINSLLDSIPDIIFFKDVNGVYLGCNPPFAKFVGRPRDKIIGKTDHELFDKDAAAFFREQDKRMLERKQPRHNEEWVTYPDGVKVLLDTLKTPYWGPDGELVGILGLSRDITERKRAQDALEDSEEKTRLLLDSAAEAIYGIDLDGTCTFCNSACLRMLGYTKPEELLGKNMHWQIHSKYADGTPFPVEDCRIFRAFQKGEGAHVDDEVLWRANGTSFLAEYWSYPQRRAGKVSGAVVTFLDITDRRRGEAFEAELLLLSTQLTGIPASGIPAALDLALQKIGRFLAADRAYIFEINSADDTMNNTHEWCSEGVSPEIGNLQKLPCGVFPMWMAALRRRENVVIPSVLDLPDAWRSERDVLEPQGIQSLFVIPLQSLGGLIGFVGLDFVRKKKELNPAEVNLLTVWSRLLSSLISSQHAEELLEKVRKNYQTFFNSINDFLFILDEKGNILHANDTVISRLGYSKEELTGLSVLMMHPPERREEAGRIVAEMLAGTTESCPVPLVTKSGGRIPVETRVTAGFWDGKPAIFGVTKDISQIQLSEEKFSKAFHSNSALMAISSLKDGRFIDVNQAFLRTLGFTRDEVVGRTSGEMNLFPGDNKRGDIVEKIKQGKTVRDVEMSVRTKDGSLKDGLFSADAIYIGKDLCLLTVLVDVTRLKQAEQAIKETAEIKSKFASMVSHELRSPLTAITLGISLVLEETGSLSPEHKNLLELVHDNADRLGRLINNVLDFQKMAAGKMVFDVLENDIGELVRATARSMGLLAQNRGLDIAVDLAEGLPRVMFDKDKITQVLTNLISNAIAHTEKGTIIVRATHERGMLCVSVRDTGLGMKPADLSKLFQAFEQLDSGRGRKKGGTGLGLAISREIIVAHNGKIWAESELGIGSTFHFTLPVQQGGD